MESWPEIIILSLWTNPNDIYHHPVTECALGNAFKPSYMNYLLNYVVKCQILLIFVCDSEGQLYV